MKILFVSGTCSKIKYEKIFEERRTKSIDPSQKFFHLILEGLDTLKEVEKIDIISILPVSSSTHKKYLWKKEAETEGIKLKYHYIGFLNGKIMRYITIMINTFINELRWQITNKEEKIIICDPTLLFSTISIKFLKLFFNAKVVGIITDVPEFATIIEHKKMGLIRAAVQKKYDFLATFLCNHLDGYILLTEQMNEKVNIKKKPYIIIEGSVDCNMAIRKNLLCKKDSPSVIMYAGGVHEKFGIIKLVNAVHAIDSKNIELHIYGGGQATTYIKEIEKIDSRIQYKGIVSTDEIVELESRATLLVNPRPTNEEFTKYSFPSKTLEYMVSGTPLLTTKLAGIPQEYFDYVYTIDNEDEEELSIQINKIINTHSTELLAFGDAGKKFVLNNKNNIIQGEKIFAFLNKL